MLVKISRKTMLNLIVVQDACKTLLGILLLCYLNAVTFFVRPARTINTINSTVLSVKKKLKYLTKNLPNLSKLKTKDSMPLSIPRVKVKINNFNQLRSIPIVQKQQKDQIFNSKYLERSSRVSRPADEPGQNTVKLKYDYYFQSESNSKSNQLIREVDGTCTYRELIKKSAYLSTYVEAQASNEIVIMINSVSRFYEKVKDKTVALDVPKLYSSDTQKINKILIYARKIGGGN